jgi:hypothetical protein
MSAKRHNVPMSLAAALVAIAEKGVTEDLDRDVVTVARKSWGAP